MSPIIITLLVLLGVGLLLALWLMGIYNGLVVGVNHIRAVPSIAHLLL